MPNPLSRIGAFFSSVASVVSPEGESVIGIDFGSAYLKVVQLRRKAGKAVLETYGELALGPYAGVEVGRATKLSSEKLIEALRDIMREAHVTTTIGGAAIPFGSSLVMLIDMPALPEEELPVAVPIEARKYVPVPISEVNLNWWIVPKEPATGISSGVAAGIVSSPRENLQVLIAAIHHDAMTRYESVVKDAGMSGAFFEIELFSTIRALFPQDLEPRAVLDLGAAETKLYLIDRGLLRISHTINHGAQDLTLALSRAENISVETAEKKKRAQGILSSRGTEVGGPVESLLSFVFSEVGQALASFERRFGRAAREIILSGGGANLSGVEEFARGELSVPVSRANPFGQVEAPAFLDTVLRRVGPEFSVALGAALRGLEDRG